MMERREGAQGMFLCGPFFMVKEMFTAQQKRVMLMPFIKKGLELKMSATKMYEQIRGTALGIRKKDFLGLVREIKGLQERAEDTIKYTRTEYLFPKGVDVVDWNLRRPILARFKVQFEREEKPRYYSIYYDSPVTFRQAKGDLLAMLGEYPEEYQTEDEWGLKRIMSVEPLATAVSREFSPGWLKKRFGF